MFNIGPINLLSDGPLRYLLIFLFWYLLKKNKTKIWYSNIRTYLRSISESRLIGPLHWFSSKIDIGNQRNFSFTSPGILMIRKNEQLEHVFATVLCQILQYFLWWNSTATTISREERFDFNGQLFFALCSGAAVFCAKEGHLILL